MKTLQDLKNTINKLQNDLISLGVKVEDMQICVSETKFGNSVYLYVGSYKVRCSDHSTGAARILSEINVSDFNYNQVLHDLEVLFFSERFKKVITLEFDNEEERTEKAMVSNIYDYVILGERIGKRGNKIFKVRLRKKEVISYVRK